MSLIELRAAVALSRLRGEETGESITWSPAEWAGVWLRLTPRQQRVVFLHVLVGLTLTEVSRALDLSRGTIDGAWRRALARIRDAVPW